MRRRPPFGHGSEGLQSRLATPWSPTFRTLEVDTIDQWFENFCLHEVTPEEMAAASFDVNFKEELSAIEQWFEYLSEAERTATLYIHLRHSTQVQICFSTTVLVSIQSQMEAKFTSMNLKSPGLKFTMPGSPSACTSNSSATDHQSLTVDSSSSFLSPDTTNTIGNSSNAATMLIQQRAKLKAAGIEDPTAPPPPPVLSPGGSAPGASGSSGGSAGGGGLSA
ncbi:hypothetical protein EDB83DRAFT_2527155 [Lactarius deliciosus]|nr:hypothetical protein EDB83DRAFT_2527155 [Lactarius deliciosus]